jgi:hypothetical protein
MQSLAICGGQEGLILCFPKLEQHWLLKKKSFENIGK